ncbi:GHMP family kinase ATP-binding protein [Streptomyces sp. NBC_00539]|uniref:GHMP family kinase ATP-binding protein n=1 Tax=Streptomyces sp. NBC_00539 TaxID=2975770 RepID=UPI002E81A540|nr:kinase [Streptomyces sp. NBC_00539]
MPSVTTYAPGTEPGAPAPAVGHAFGTFGELLQGALPEPDGDFLVTFPLAHWATATFHHRPGQHGVRVHPPHKGKSRRVAEVVLASLGVEGGGLLEIGGGLPEGKGLASSSADLVATVRAVGAAFGRSFDPDRTEAFLRGIEPADGVMYDEIVAFHHREVRLRRRLGVLPPLAVVAHDEGGQVDTVAHNLRAGGIGPDERREYARLLDRLAAAIAGADLAEVGAVATRSAEMNAARRVRSGFRDLRALCREVDGLGLVLAHSGTMLGVLLDAADPELAAKTDRIRTACAPLGGEVSVHRSLGAGDRWNPAHDEPVPDPDATPAASTAADRLHELET